MNADPAAARSHPSSGLPTGAAAGRPVGTRDAVATSDARGLLHRAQAGEVVVRSSAAGGTCPHVGVAGLAWGGGMGVLGRQHGVLSDRLVAVQAVLADGRLVTCDTAHHADLFWALRGAGGGSSCLVTRLDFRSVPARPTSTNVHARWPIAHAKRAIHAWQAQSIPNQASPSTPSNRNRRN